MEKIKDIKEQYGIIGREKEIEACFEAIIAGKHVLLSGPVGVGKTRIASALADYFNKSFYRIDGDERYTEIKMTGWFDPALVIVKGYSPETFIPGLLVKAMEEGAFLFINELNRMPEGTQNVLLPAMDEGKIIVPKIGLIKANSGFLIIATQNPEEFVGTNRLSEALKDRFVNIPLDYQSEDEEIKIVQKEADCHDEYIVNIAVKINRTTREHPDIRRGASIRGAIDITDLMNSKLVEYSIFDADNWINPANMALSMKIDTEDQTIETKEKIIREIVESTIEKYLKKTDVDDLKKKMKRK